MSVVQYLMVSKASGTTGPGGLSVPPLEGKVGYFKASSVASLRQKPVCECRFTSQGQVKISEEGTIQPLWIFLFTNFHFLFILSCGYRNAAVTQWSIRAMRPQDAGSQTHLYVTTTLSHGDSE